MVVGSGPAGMEAAEIARLRGHHVSIWERDAQLGGKLEVAGLAPSKREVLRFRDFQARRLGELGVEIHTGAEVTAQAVAQEAPDVVVVATGAEPLIPPIPGIGAAHVHDAQAFLRGDLDASGCKVAIVGGSATGCEAAELLADQRRFGHHPRDARKRRPRDRGDHAPAPAARAQAGGRPDPHQGQGRRLRARPRALRGRRRRDARRGLRPRRPRDRLEAARQRARRRTGQASRSTCWATPRAPPTSSPRSTPAPTQDSNYDHAAQGRPPRPGGQSRSLPVPRARCARRTRSTTARPTARGW